MTDDPVRKAAGSAHGAPHPGPPESPDTPESPGPPEPRAVSPAKTDRAGSDVAQGAVTAASRRLVLAYLNDLHWNFLVYPRILTALRKARAQHEDILFFDIGDTLSDVYEGKPLVSLMNLARVDGWVLGNHDFDYGVEYLRARIADAKFPVVVANLRTRGSAKLPLVRSLRRTCGGLRTAFFGLTTPDYGPGKHPPPGVTILDPIATAREMVTELRPRADLLVCLSHLGFEADCELALAVPGIDVIIGGHSHTLLPSPALVGSTLICQAGGEGHFLGFLHVSGEPGALRYQGELVGLDAALAPDPEAESLLARWTRASVTSTHARVLGEAATSFVDEKYGRETALGNLICDTLREETGAHVAFYNATGVNNVIPAGPIGASDLAIAFHFDNAIWVLEMTGAQILQVLEKSLEACLDDNYYFLHSSGIKVRYSSRRPAGSRVLGVTYDGVPMRSERRYRVAITDFLAGGGHEGGRQFHVFATLPKEKTPFTTRGLMVALVQRRGRIFGAVEGRIVDEGERRSPARLAAAGGSGR